VTDLAIALDQRLGQAVNDTTSLNGIYDFVLTFSADGLPRLLDPLGFPIQPPIGVEPRLVDLPNVFTAVEEQLGLRLDRAKTRIDVVVIDQAAKTPIPN
jgi:uncharacterized protein (TIGR03435 family)